MSASRSLPAWVLPLALFALNACANHSRGRSGQVTPLRSIGFESRLLIETGAVAGACTVAVDADRNGRIDLVTASLDGTLVVALGQAGGSFATGQRLTLPARPVALNAADLDRDGDADLVTVMADGTAQVFRGDGRGGFLAFGPRFAVGRDALDAQLGDVDGDGAPDLVVVEHAHGDFGLFRGLGDLGFMGRISLLPPRRGAFCGFPRIADFDGDGRQDLACADFSLGRVVVLLGDGTGLPTRDHSVDVGGGCFGLAAGDLDGDGRAELFAPSLAERRIAVLAYLGGTRLEIVQSLPTEGAPSSVYAADLDGDQQLDLASVLLDRHAIAVHHGLGGALAATPIEMPVSGSATTPFAADLDGDSVADLIAPAFGAPVVNVYLGRRPGSLRGGRFHRVPGVASPAVVHAGDFDGDGARDVVTAGFDGSVVSITIGRGDGFDLALEPLASIELGRLVQNVHAADLDRDGRVDLVVPVVGGVKLLANRSRGGNVAFDVLPPGDDAVLAPGDGPFEVLVGDVDGDRLRDVVVAYHVESRVTLLRGTATPFVFAAPQDTPIEGRAFGLALGDFDGDGLNEVATSRLERATITLLEVTRDGLVPVLDIPVGPGPNYLRAGDFDANGATDLVVSDGAGNSITVLVSRRGGAFQSTTIAAGSGPTALLAADLNRDGFDDVLVAAQGSSECRVVLGDGRGGFGAPIVFPALHQAIAAALADLDDDGLPDLLLGSFESRAIATFINRSRRD